MLERIQQPPADPRRDKLNGALETLMSFVEFDENLSQWEKDLVERIRKKGYSSEECREKMDRVKGVIEVLRINAIPS